jgi:TIR domain
VQVFISWSGNRSKAVAELLSDWIQCVLQAIRPWISSKDIDRGSLWFSEITDQLKDTKIGLVCLTKDNLDKPWILFEAGALAKGLSSSRVCTFLIDLESTEVRNPLAQFNHTMPTKEGLYELILTLNSSLGEHSLKEKVLEQVFNTYWPQFEIGFKNALEEHPAQRESMPRSEDSILSEVLRTVRSLDRRVRSVEKEKQHHTSTKNEYLKWLQSNPIARGGPVYVPSINLDSDPFTINLAESGNIIEPKDSNDPNDPNDD